MQPWWCSSLDFPPSLRRRFLLPALQLCIPVCGAGLYHLFLFQQQQPRAKPESSNGGRRGSSSPNKEKLRRWRRAAALLCLVLQVPAATYLSTFHQRGPVAVMDVLAFHAKALGAPSSSSASSTTTPMTVFFLMPCHSTPFHSHVHSPSVSMAFLDCSPPGLEGAVRRLNCPRRLHHNKGETEEEEEEEASLAVAPDDDASDGGAAAAPSWACSLPTMSGAAFAKDPGGTAARLLGGARSIEDSEDGRPRAAPPSHVVMFGAAAGALDPVLRGFGYRESERVFNTHVALDEAQAGDTIVVYTRIQLMKSLSDEADDVRNTEDAAAEEHIEAINV